MTSRVNEDFALELREVKTAALILGQSIDQHNFLPDDFPKLQMQLLITSLSGLGEGSLEGAKLPLEHATVRISEIRRRCFIHPEYDRDSDDEVRPPALERGDALDGQFSRLLSAISTALDAYREQSRSEYESLNTQEYFDLLPRIAIHSEETPDISKQINEIESLSRHAREREWSHIDLVGEVALSAADAKNSLVSAEAEAVSRFVIRGWIKRLALHSADALNALRKSVDTIAVIGGVSYEFYLRYKSTVSNIRNIVVKEAQDWLSFISLQLDKAEKNVRKIADDKERKNYGLIRSMGGRILF